jgi:transposase
MERTAVCVLDETGEVILERSVSSDPAAIIACLESPIETIGRIGLEAGPLGPWLYSGLADHDLPVFCIEVRQMKAFAKASPVKTDKRDARLIAPSNAHWPVQGDPRQDRSQPTPSASAASSAIHGPPQ